VQPQLQRMPSITSGISRIESKSGMRAGDFESWSEVRTLLPVIPGRGFGCGGMALANIFLRRTSSSAAAAEQEATKLRRLKVVIVFIQLAHPKEPGNKKANIEGAFQRCLHMA